MRSKNFEKWKSYYQQGLISEEKLKKLIGKPLGITEEEYKIIIEEFSL